MVLELKLLSLFLDLLVDVIELVIHPAGQLPYFVDHSLRLLFLLFLISPDFCHQLSCCLLHLFVMLVLYTVVLIDLIHPLQEVCLFLIDLVLTYLDCSVSFRDANVDSLKHIQGFVALEYKGF